MKSRLGMLLCFALSASLPSASQGQTQDRASRPEEVEWTWEVRPVHVNPRLPNVLLVGDSITRNYYPEVQQELANEANVYLFAASTSVGDPRLLHELSEFATLEGVRFQVVHFNNGMHGWRYSEAEYRTAFPGYLRTLHRIAPKASFIWASITPVKADDAPGPTNSRIEERNRIALSFLAHPAIAVDDQHELMAHHGDQHEDNVHFNAAGAKIQGEQAVRFIRAVLPKK